MTSRHQRLLFLFTGAATLALLLGIAPGKRYGPREERAGLPRRGFRSDQPALFELPHPRRLSVTRRRQSSARDERQARSRWQGHAGHALHQLSPGNKLLASARSAGQARLAAAAPLHAFGMERTEYCRHLPRAERSLDQRRHDHSPTDRARQRRPIRELGLESGSGTRGTAVVTRRVRFAL